MWSVALVATAACLACAAAFNVLPQGAIVFTPPSGTRLDHFGYSVALVQSTFNSRRKWVVVSAPAAASRIDPDSRFTKPGAIFRCQVQRETNAPFCAQIALKQGVTDGRIEDELNVANGTLGSGLDAVPDSDGMFVCNSAFKHLIANQLDMLGRCFWLDNIDGEKPLKFMITNTQNAGGKLFIQIDNKIYRDNTRTQMMGFSAHVTQKYKKLLMGSPGYFWGRGAVSLSDHRGKESWGVAIPLLRNDSYFGYSVASGKFLSSGEEVYVSGAPRGDADDLTGRVVIFTFKGNDSTMAQLNITKVLNGSQIGEYFGSVLCVVDINGDGVDDLLVGAPLHKSVISDEGKVYMFLSNGKFQVNMTEVEPGLTGNKISGARFGTALAALGDINKDGYQDIAIGAPYEDEGRGAVYIFYSSPSAPYFTRSQRIAATAISNNLRGFGFSLSRGSDFDNNSYNDVTAGAYLSNEAVLLRTSPVLYLHSSVKSSGKIPMNAELVDFAICVGPGDLPKNVGVSVTINVDPIYNRASLGNKWKVFSYVQNMTTDQLMVQCKNYSLNLKMTKKIFKPLEIELNFKILYPLQNNRTFCHLCPVLDPKLEKVSHHLYFETGCVSKECKTDFTVKAAFVGIQSPLTIGNISNIEMAVEVQNSMEYSYETNITITLPSAVPLRQIHKSCHRENSENTTVIKLVCDVPYVMNKTTEPFKVHLIFDMDRVPWEVNELLVDISVQGDGEEQTPNDNRLSLLLQLEHIANVYIKGRSTPESLEIVTKRNDSDDLIFQDKTFEHTYTVINEGPSPIHGLNVQFSFPNKMKTGATEITYFLVEQRNPYDISPDSNEVEYKSTHEMYEDTSYLLLDCSNPTVECQTESYIYSKTIYKNSGVTFSFKITGLFKEQGPLLKRGSVIVRSTGAIMNEFLLDQQLPEHKAFRTWIETVLHGSIPKGEVQSWIIVVAVICGILILIGLVVILWRYGFFKRKKPPTAEDLSSNEKPNSEEKVDTDPLYEDNP